MEDLSPFLYLFTKDILCSLFGQNCQLFLGHDIKVKSICSPLPPPCTLAEFLQEHHHVLEARMLPTVREIADTRARSRDELEGV